MLHLALMLGLRKLPSYVAGKQRAASAQRMQRLAACCRGSGRSHFKDENWSISPDRIIIAKRDDGCDWKLGSGSFGTVSLDGSE